MTVIDVKNISKKYNFYNSEIKRVLSWFGVSNKPTDIVTILDGISFSMDKGDAIGIIGLNGSGKSTLLKMVAGVTKPTSGEIKVNAKVSAILELGMGFHPDFTGRQNAINALGMQGYNKKEIKEILPSLKAFTEIGDYFEKPIRIYSSGMQMRVAFAVATAFRPDVLIVDEALSVGDSYFQHKSYARIKEYVSQGTGLLFVSHDKGVVLQLCSRALLLKDGKIFYDGNPEKVMDMYNALLADKENTVNASIEQFAEGNITSGNKKAIIESVGLFNMEGNKVETVKVGARVELRVIATINEKLDSLVLGYGIKDRLGSVIYGTNTWHTKQIIYNLNIGDTCEFKILFDANIGPGSYSVEIALTEDETHLKNNYEWRNYAVCFSVVNLDKTFFVGSAWCEPQIVIEHHV